MNLRLSLAIALVSIHSAQAANVVVQKNGQFPTIQSGIDAAGAGGTVTVKAGVYQETPVVPAGLAGLTLKASGNVVIDARLPGGDPAGNGLTIDAADVFVRGFTIRHAAVIFVDSGRGVSVSAPRARLEKLKIVNCADTSIYLDAANCEVRNCTLVGAKYGVVTFDPATIDKCTFVGCTNYGILSGQADGLVLRRNTIVDCHAGIYADGANAIVEKNTVVRSNQTAIYVDSSAATVRGNKVIGSLASAGIECLGDDATIENNIVTHTRFEGLWASGQSLTIRKNRITAALGEGIYVDGGSTILLESNTIDNARIFGMNVFGSIVTARKNVVRRSGRHDTPVGGGYRFAGNDFIIEKNTAKDCLGDGFLELVDGAELLDNVSIGNTKDGFDIGGSNCEVVHNIALKNSGEGFDLGGTTMSLKNNVAKGNRIDVAAWVPPDSFDANSFGSGGTSTQPEID